MYNMCIFFLQRYVFHKTSRVFERELNSNLPSGLREFNYYLLDRIEKEFVDMKDCQQSTLFTCPSSRFSRSMLTIIYR